MTSSGTVEMVRAGNGLFAVRARGGRYAIGAVKGDWKPELGQVVHGDLASPGDVALRVGAKRYAASLLACGCTRSDAWEMLS
jgi:hypothetical protein